jgi:probable rRNA maturation factor
MPLPPLELSLQFARFADAAAHRAVLARHGVRRWLRHSMDASVASARFTVRVVDAEEGRALNHTYRQRDYATNVLTFGYVEAPNVEADLVLCAPVVAREAAEQNKTLAEHYAHLIVHGGLHAQGWDHEVESEAEAMEAREIAILAGLGFANPYA